jgi:hypothetical protein
MSAKTPKKEWRVPMVRGGDRMRAAEASACHIPDVTPFLPAAAFFATVQEIGPRTRFAPIAIRPSIRIFPQRHAFDLQPESLSDHRASPDKKSNTEPGRVWRAEPRFLGRQTAPGWNRGGMPSVRKVENRGRSRCRSGAQVMAPDKQSLVVI